jgi:Tfp pilus assembly protein PilF
MKKRTIVLWGSFFLTLSFCLVMGCTHKQKDYSQLEVKDISDQELDKAIEFYEKYVLTRPKDLKSHNKMGILYRRSGNLDRARVQYEYVLLMDSTNAEAHNNLGTWYGIVNQVDSGICEFRLAVKYNPDYSKAHRNLAAMYQRSNQDSLALVEMEIYLRTAMDTSDTAGVRKAMEALKEKMRKR